MGMQLDRVGHCLIKVRDVERSSNFYVDVLGFQLMEKDPDHGGVFLSLPNDGHTIDLSPVGNPDAAAPPVGQQDGVGVLHIGFKVASYEALHDAYDTLRANNVEVLRMIDHVSQRSMYFSDPDGNTLEIYYEFPRAREIFLAGRGDLDKPFTWNDPLPAHATTAD